MRYLILYYSLIDNKYIYRLFNDCEDCLNFRDRILKSGLSRTAYVYKLYGRMSIWI